MNGYKAFYRGKSMEVMAETSYKAQQIAAEKFKAKKRHEVTIMLCELDNDGKTVTHIADF